MQALAPPIERGPPWACFFECRRKAFNIASAAGTSFRSPDELARDGGPEKAEIVGRDFPPE